MNEIVQMTKLVPPPAKTNVTEDGVKVLAAKQVTMKTLLGIPSTVIGPKCTMKVDNPSLKALMATADVGPFRVTGLRPAVESLARVLSDVAAEQPAIYAALGHEGMLCVRHVRDNPSAISNHAWGTAIDLTLEGKLDARGDGKVQAGLTLIAPIFNRHGWFWGVDFGVEDAMHFEASDGLIRSWAAKGLFGKDAPTAPKPYTLSMGDRGDEVRLLQESLNADGAGLFADGIFGVATQTAVMRFQSAKGLPVTGVVDGDTWAQVRILRRDTGLAAADGNDGFLVAALGEDQGASASG